MDKRLTKGWSVVDQWLIVGNQREKCDDHSRWSANLVYCFSYVYIYSVDNRLIHIAKVELRIGSLFRVNYTYLCALCLSLSEHTHTDFSKHCCWLSPSASCFVPCSHTWPCVWQGCLTSCTVSVWPFSVSQSSINLSTFPPFSFCTSQVVWIASWTIFC